MEEEKKRYLIIGFPNCGTTSLEEYLTAQGHDVRRWETVYKRGTAVIEATCRFEERVPIAITRKENRYNVDCEKVLKNLKHIKDLEVVTLDEMMKKSDFPQLNERGTRIGDKIANPST